MNDEQAIKKKPRSKHVLEVELEQRETLENLSYWRQNLMSSVLPASKRGLEGAER